MVARTAALGRITRGTTARLMLGGRRGITHNRYPVPGSKWSVSQITVGFFTAPRYEPERSLGCGTPPAIMTRTTKYNAPELRDQILRSSPRRKPGSSRFRDSWIPAFAGMTCGNIPPILDTYS